MKSVAHGVTVTAKLRQSRKDMCAEIEKIVSDYKPPGDLMLPVYPNGEELTMLHTVLKDKFPSYIRHLGDIMRKIRCNAMEAGFSVADIDHQFSNALHGCMEKTKFVEALEQVIGSDHALPLVEDDRNLLCTHFDRRGNGEIDLKHFFTWLHKVIPPRQYLIEQAFEKLCPKSDKSLPVNVRKLLQKLQNANVPLEQYKAHEIWFVNQQSRLSKILVARFNLPTGCSSRRKRVHSFSIMDGILSTLQ